MEVLTQRLQGRESEDEESLHARLERARLELEYMDQFDQVVVNDDLEKAVDVTAAIITKFLSNT